MLQARIMEWVAFPFSRGSSQPRDRIQVFRIAAGFFTAEPQGKPKNTGVGSLSLLQRIFPTQESNQSPALQANSLPTELSGSLSLFTFLHWRRKWQPTPVFLPGESQGQQSLVGCRLWGRTESDMTEVT